MKLQREQKFIFSNKVTKHEEIMSQISSFNSQIAEERKASK